MTYISMAAGADGADMSVISNLVVVVVAVQDAKFQTPITIGIYLPTAPVKSRLRRRMFGVGSEEVNR